MIRVRKVLIPVTSVTDSGGVLSCEIQNPANSTLPGWFDMGYYAPYRVVAIDATGNVTYAYGDSTLPGGWYTASLYWLIRSQGSGDFFYMGSLQDFKFYDQLHARPVIICQTPDTELTGSAAAPFVAAGRLFVECYVPECYVQPMIFI